MNEEEKTPNGVVCCLLLFVVVKNALAFSLDRFFSLFLLPF
jgi:hypothetical protein